MNKRIPVLVLTGAGASRAVPINLPTMTEFFQQIMSKERLPKSQRISDPNYFKFIFDTLYGNEDNYDLERVMGSLYDLSGFTENDCWKIFQHPKIYDEIINTITNTYPNFYNGQGHPIPVGSTTIKNNIKQNILNTYQVNKDSAKKLIFELEWLIREKYEIIPTDHIRKVYEPLFELLIQNINELGSDISPVIPFFTTNYDMSIDWFFEPEDDEDSITQELWASKFEKTITYIDGFEPKRGWSVNEYTKIEKDSDFKNEIFIPYYKLHGSLFWEKRAKKIRKGTNTANDSFNPRELMIVYPSDKKILYNEPYDFNHRSLNTYLKNTNVVVTIGFSFRDPAIVRSFENALFDNSELIIIVIAPGGFDSSYFPEMDKFLKLERVIWIKGYFGEQTTIDELAKLIGS